jgi:hypothetical protein
VPFVLVVLVKTSALMSMMLLFGVLLLELCLDFFAACVLLRLSMLPLLLWLLSPSLLLLLALLLPFLLPLALLLPSLLLLLELLLLLLS